MQLTWVLAAALLAALATAAPAAQDRITVRTSAFFLNNPVVYSSQHDIVSLAILYNGVNFDPDYKGQHSLSDLKIFFAEADVNDKGEKDYKGLYLLKDNKATLVLATGTDAAANSTDSKILYISATDGLYVYTADSGKVERYGAVTDNLVSVVKLNSSDVLYVLTADNVVYKVTDNGQNKVKVNDIKDAKQIMLDNSDHLYYYGADKQLYVLGEAGVKKIKGLPANPGFVSLYKPLPEIRNGVPFLSDTKAYTVRADGTSELSIVTFEAAPTAFSMDGGDLNYYAYNKNIYKMQ